jgi:hypothetical protein
MRQISRWELTYEHRTCTTSFCLWQENSIDSFFPPLPITDVSKVKCVKYRKTDNFATYAYTYMLYTQLDTNSSIE